MSTETAALETKPASVADALPESLRATLSRPADDYGAGEIWPDRGQADPTPKAKVEPAKKEEAAAEPVIEVKSLATKWGAKVKAPAADVAALVKPADKATPAPEEKTVDAPVEVKADEPEEKVALSPGVTAKTASDFRTVRNMVKHERKRAEAAEAALERARNTPAPVGAFDSAEFDRIKAEHKAMSDKLLVIDTANHPVFQSQYVAPRKEALAAANELLKAHGKEANLAALIEKPRGEIGKALAEILTDVPQFDQAEISANVRQAWKLAQDEKAALSKANEVNGAIRQNDSQTHVHAFDKTWDKLAGNLSESLEPAEIPANATPEQRRGIEAYNEAMSKDSIRAAARAIATGAQSYESISEASMKAVMYDRHIQHVMPRIGAEVNEMLNIIKAQKAELDGYKKRNPNREISASQTQARSAANTESKSIDQIADEHWGNSR